MNWSVDECMSHFQTLCAEAFTRRGGMNILGVNKVLESIHHSKYETRPLQKALKETFSEDDYLFGGPRVQNSRTKVAVTATSSGSVSVLANYNRSCESKRKSPTATTSRKVVSLYFKTNLPFSFLYIPKA
jgi:hypothetical protein